MLFERKLVCLLWSDRCWEIFIYIKSWAVANGLAEWMVRDTERTGLED